MLKKLYKFKIPQKFKNLKYFIIKKENLKN